MLELSLTIWEVPTPDHKRGKLFVSESAAESYRVSAAESGIVLPEAYRIPVWSVPTTTEEQS
jgi:hypothetical protein